MRNGTSLCSVEDDSINVKNGLSSGLSGGAIARIIIGCIVVMIIIGSAIAYFAFSFKPTGVATVQYISSSSQTTFPVNTTAANGNNAA